jgi:hypothetical protein
LNALPGTCSLAASQNLGCGLRDFAFQLVELLLDDFFVIRKVCFKPLKSSGVVLGFEVFFELIKLLVGHLVGQADADAHFQGLVDMLEKAVLFSSRQRRQTDFLQE